MAIVFPEGTQNLPARVIQVVSDYSDTHYTSLASESWHTIGNLSVSITPATTACKILLLAQASWWIDNGNEVAVRFRRGTTAVATGSGTNLQGTSMDYQESGAGWKVNTTPLMALDNPGTTSQLTYTVQIYPQGGNLWINRSYNTSGGDSVAAISTLTALEIVEP